MRKIISKGSYTYGDLIKSRYGVSSPKTMIDLRQFEGLITEYYGKSHQQKKEKIKASSPTVLSLSFDQDEVLIQPESKGHYKEYVVQSSVEDVVFEEYVIDADRLSLLSSTRTKEIDLPTEAPSVDKEYLMDIFHALGVAHSPTTTLSEIIPPSAVLVVSNEDKTSQTPLADQPTLLSPAETNKASEADFLEDMQSILTGHKVFDPVSKKTVEKEKLGSPPSESDKNGMGERPVPEAKNEQAIFDRIAQSMQYANSFDLGSVDLENRFADFDRISDLQQKAPAKRKPQVKPIPDDQPSPSLRVDSTDFVEDLDIIRNQNAAMPIQLEEPAASFSNTINDGTMSTTIPEIEDLDLAETAKQGAYVLRQKHPAIVFTSGRRSKQQQAHAMAGNVLLNRKWVEQTYADSGVRAACQKWADDNPEKKTEAEIEQGLLEVLNRYTNGQLGVLSKHIIGMAFDVQSVEGGEDIKASIRALAGLDKFLEKEGDLVRWHVQFK